MLFKFANPDHESDGHDFVMQYDSFTKFRTFNFCFCLKAIMRYMLHMWELGNIMDNM